MEIYKNKVRRGRYNMDFDPKNGDPYGNLKKVREHIDAIKGKRALDIFVSPDQEMHK